MSTAESNKQQTRRFSDVMQRGDAEAIANTYAEEGRVVTMGNTLISGSRGKEEIRQFAGGVLDAFPGGAYVHDSEYDRRGRPGGGRGHFRGSSCVRAAL